eukprot:sb/3461915/
MDEQPSVCNDVTLSDVTCIRRVGGYQTNVSYDMVHNGDIDCRSGVDEEEDKWQKCNNVFWESKTKTCTQSAFLMPFSGRPMLVSELCDDKIHFGSENEMCRNFTVFTKILETKGTRFVSYCLPGFTNYDMTNFSRTCTTISYPGFEEVFAVKKRQYVIPQMDVDCRYIYGELYVVMACNGKCTDKTPCPITMDTAPTKCTNLPFIYSLSKSNTLQQVYKVNGEYRNDLFQCSNSLCVTWDKVCNLENDCGDSSDETICENNFTCTESGKLIPKSMVCDGKIDCARFEDECDVSCNYNVDMTLLVYGTLIGVGAILANSVVMVSSVSKIRDAKSFLGIINRMFIFTIVVGDLMMGIYLTGVSTTYFTRVSNPQELCREQYYMLTESSCTAFGVLATIGSQLSLFAMTAISLFRLVSVTSWKMQRRVTTSKLVLIIIIITVIFLLALTIAIIPLIPGLEDSFNLGMYLHQNPLFRGILKKEDLADILQQYYGRFRTNDLGSLSWDTLNKTLITPMFVSNGTGQRDDSIQARSVSFYGNEGGCMFRYFVVKDDHDNVKWYSIAILSLNFCCFVVITAASILLHLKNSESTRKLLSKKFKSMRSQGVGMKMKNAKNNKLQTKLSILIATDFCCWIPFIVVCGLNYHEIVDAKDVYLIFSFVVLPINSMVNPLLHDDTIINWFTKLIKTLLRVLYERLAPYKAPEDPPAPGSPPPTRSSVQDTRVVSNNVQPEPVSPSSPQLGPRPVLVAGRKLSEGARPSNPTAPRRPGRVSLGNMFSSTITPSSGRGRPSRISLGNLLNSSPMFKSNDSQTSNVTPNSTTFRALGRFKNTVSEKQIEKRANAAELARRRQNLILLRERPMIQSSDEAVIVCRQQGSFNVHDIILEEDEF